MRVEALQQARDLEVPAEPLGRGVGSDTDRDTDPVEKPGDALHRLQLGGDHLGDPFVDPDRHLVRQRLAALFGDDLQHGVVADADELAGDFGRRDRIARARELLGVDPTIEDLAVDQHAIAIEDDEVGCGGEAHQ